ncbi:MAG: hypothetical protein PIR02_15860 [Microbacterium enclense]
MATRNPVRTRFPGFNPTANFAPDASLTDGDLLLLDPGRPDGTWEGTQIPNLAAASAKRITGSDVGFATLFNSFASTASGRVERTAKGRPHIMVSKQSNTSSGATGLGAGAGLQILAALKAYFEANPTHVYTFVFAFKLTRGYTATAPALYPLFGLKTPASLANSKVYTGITASGTLSGVPTAAPDRLGLTGTTLPGDSSEKYVAITAKGFTLSTAVSTIMLYLGAWDSATQNRAPSIAISRVRATDLSAGTDLTHGNVVARDQRAWSASLSVGGYYYGDTMSDPAELVP